MSPMATLQHTQTQQLVELTNPTLVGRSRSSHLRLDGRHVSGTHATISWTGQQWEVRDLGSRNGTFLNGHRLPSGERGALTADASVSFGDAADAWRVLSEEPPAAFASADREQRRAADGILALPDEDTPEVCVYRAATGWIADAGDRSWQVRAGDTVEAGGRRWRLELPEDLRPTQELGDGGLSLAFQVSRDEEHIELVARAGAHTVTLRHRAHSYLLLTLARARLDDTDRDLPETEHGWLYVDDLWPRIASTEGHFNMFVFRARQQFAQAGFADADALIERRRGSRQLRLGVSDLRVERL